MHLIEEPKRRKVVEALSRALQLVGEDKLRLSRASELSAKSCETGLSESGRRHPPTETESNFTGFENQQHFNERPLAHFHNDSEGHLAWNTGGGSLTRITCRGRIAWSEDCTIF